MGIVTQVTELLQGLFEECLDPRVLVRQLTDVEQVQRTTLAHVRRFDFAPRRSPDRCRSP
jgi:hypothetical protein